MLALGRGALGGGGVQARPPRLTSLLSRSRRVYSSKQWPAAAQAADAAAAAEDSSRHPNGETHVFPRIMHPDWYRTPMAEDDPRMIGDYPDVPAESYQHRDPHDPTYTDPQNRRRFGEPVPEDYEVLTVWSFDHERTYSAKFILGGLAGFFGTMYLLYEGLRRVPNPLVPFGVRSAISPPALTLRLPATCPTHTPPSPLAASQKHSPTRATRLCRLGLRKTKYFINSNVVVARLAQPMGGRRNAAMLWSIGGPIMRVLRLLILRLTLLIEGDAALRPADAPSQLDVPLHDGDALCMNGAQVPKQAA